MNAYNPLESSKRLEATGLARAQAEAIASEIGDSKNDLVTTDVFTLKLDTLDAKFEVRLDAALNRQLVRIGVLFAALLTLATSAIALLNSLR